MTSDASGRRSDSAVGGLRWMVRALAHRNYQLFFVGHGISLIGTWMTRMATLWLVHRLTGSALFVGLVTFMSQIPLFLVAPLVGVLVDRWPRRRILVVTQALGMLQSLGLAAVAFLLPAENSEPEAAFALGCVLVLSLFQGLVSAFDMPARQAFIVEMVVPEDLANAIALNSSLFNSARLIGPMVAGFVVYLAGEAWCFVADGLSYLAVIAALLAMTLPPRRTRLAREPLWREWQEGWKYVSGFPPVRSVLLLLALVSFMGVPYLVLLPTFVKDVLEGDARTFGWLVTASGAGALLAALALAARKSVVGLPTAIPLAAALFGAGLILFALSNVFALSLLFLVVVGFGMITQMASSNTLVQTIVDEDKRGRVMSFYTMANFGTLPLGSLFAGLMAHQVGPVATLALGGSACILGALLFASRLRSMKAMIRPVYMKMGIMSEEIQAAGQQE